MLVCAKPDELTGTSPQTRRHRSQAVRRVFFLLLLTVCACRAQTVPALADHAGPVVADDVLRLVMVPDQPPATIALAVPILAQLSTDHQAPYLLVLPTAQAVPVSSRRTLAMLPPGRAILLNRRTVYGTPDGMDRWTVQDVDTPLTVGDASLVLAIRFWKQTAVAVMAPEDQPGLIVLAAGLAAHRKVPLLLYREPSARRLVETAIRKLGLNELVVIDNRAQSPDLGALPPDVQIRRLAGKQAAKQLVRELPKRGRRTLIVTAAPLEYSGAAWLAPYFSLHRKAPILLTDATEPVAVEDAAYAFVNEHRLKTVRSFTIIGDDSLIGLHRVELTAPPAEGAVVETAQATDPAAETLDLAAELFTVPRGGRALSYAVGRFPFSDPVLTGNLMTLGFHRDQALRKQTAHVVMVANPNVAYGNLPLCETISRATSAEYENLKVRFSEFYQQASESELVLTAVRDASLIIYQGHLGDQFLLEAPMFFMEMEAAAEYPGYPESGNDIHYPDENGPLSEPEAPVTEAGGVTRAIGMLSDFWNNTTGACDDHALGAGSGQVERRFDGFPLVILQSCQSLHVESLQRVNELGGVGLVGTTTNVHSASGSAFVKTLSDGLLYERQTIGEAVRDARNYFFCLQDLKHRRGHRQQHKSMRVALSFRVWGDPELSPLPRLSRRPRRAPLAASWGQLGGLAIHLPERRLKTVRTDSYYTRLFPRAQLAGIVKSRQNPDAPRRILPLHFFRLQLPPGFLDRDDHQLRMTDGEDRRTVYRIDQTGRYLYLLHFPDKEAPNETIPLFFH